MRRAALCLRGSVRYGAGLVPSTRASMHAAACATDGDGNARKSAGALSADWYACQKAWTVAARAGASAGRLSAFSSRWLTKKPRSNDGLPKYPVS